MTLTQSCEVDTCSLFETLYPQKTVVCPRITEEKTMEMRQYHPGHLVKNKWHIDEPTATCAVVQVCDVVIVPLLAYDETGQRIGYGGGYYDRYLATQNKDCKKIGLSFFEPFEQSWPIEDTDIALDYVVSPTKIWTFSR